MKTLLSEVLVMVAVGALSIVEGIRLILKGELQTYDALGPGFYSIAVGSVLILIGLVYFVSERKRVIGAAKIARAPRPVGMTDYKKTMVGMVVAMIAYILLMDLAGYLLATVVFFLIINRIVGFRSWLANLGVTALMTAAFYLVFVSWLGIIFPRGLLVDF